MKRDHWIEILRSTGVQTGQSRLHNVKHNRTGACFRTCLLETDIFRRGHAIVLSAGLPELARDSRLARCANEAWWSRSGSNRRPQACKARALPTELRPRIDDRQWMSVQRRLVGPGRVERPTSRLSGVRSNHLSYEPETRLAHALQVHFAKTIATDPARACAFAYDGIPDHRRKKEGKRRRRSYRHLCLVRCPETT